MKSLNRAMGKTIRFLHIYQNMVIGALVIVLSIVMLIASNSIKVIASSLTAVDNAAFLPRVIFGVLICLGILFLVMGGKQTAANRATAPEGEALEKKRTRPFALWEHCWPCLSMSFSWTVWVLSSRPFFIWCL